MNRAGSSLCVPVISPQARLPQFPQTALDLGRMRGTMPLAATASQIFPAGQAASGQKGPVLPSILPGIGHIPATSEAYPPVTM